VTDIPEEKESTGDRFTRLMQFDRNLQVGQQVCIRWTNSGNHYGAMATITKVNAKSVIAALDEDITGYRTGYPKGWLIKAPRMLDMRAWSRNNCVQEPTLKQLAAFNAKRTSSPDTAASADGPDR
jgi:hypothetical protein